MIEIKNLKKSFGDLKVLNDINLSIAPGKIYGLVGRSGAGKSTLLRCINGLETYDSGSLLVDGVEVSSLSGSKAREFKKQVGMIFQQFSLLSRLSIYDNIALPMVCWNYPKKEIDKKVRELAELVGITSKLNSRPKELSGGQKQRVAIARALTLDPKILLCDEATSALDPKTAKSIIALLNDINKKLGITIVVVTHQMSVLRSCCEEIAILEHGVLAEQGPVKEIFINQPKALKNLIGVKEMLLPSTGTNIRVLMTGENYKKPILTNMSRELDIDFMILGGEMEEYRDEVLGSVIINIETTDFDRAVSYLTSHGLIWKHIDHSEFNYDLAKEGEINV